MESKLYPGKTDKIICTIEARMSSTRLPGKVLMPLAGIPSLQFLVERIRRSSFVDDVIVATTVNEKDNAIIELCKKIQCNYFRGSELDVLGRVLSTAKEFHGDIIVEITGDCPFIDHRHVDKMIKLFYSGKYDYAGMQEFPGGFGVQVYPTEILSRVDKLTNDPVDRIHVTYYIYTHPEKFNIAAWHAEGMMKWPEGRVMIDERDDYQLLDIIAKELYPENQDFSAEDVAAFLKKNPKLVDINAHVRKKDPKKM